LVEVINMSLIKSNNRSLFDQVFSDDDSLFAEVFGKPLSIRSSVSSFASVQAPKVDVTKTDGKWVFKADLPGMSKEDISVRLEDDTLTIRGERKEEKESKEKGCYHKEVSYGSFERSFNLPDTQNSEVTASYKDGVLRVEVEIPKLVTPPTGRSIKIE
jgi:HSP20 family protein